MSSGSGLRSLLCPLLLVSLIYAIWFVRYSVWHLAYYAESVFLMLILSYSGVLILSMTFLKKEASRSLHEVFKAHSYGTTIVGLLFAIILQGTLFSACLGIGCDLELLAFPSLKGYEHYAVYSKLLAFTLYVLFAIFGAFVEEVTFRGYVQSRIASKYGSVVGISIASLLFSLQHIHIFDLNWIEKFFRTQFIYVLCFGIFVGYLFFKSKEDLWSVFGFHALMNICDISLPVRFTSAYQSATQYIAIAGLVFMVFILHLLPIEEISENNDLD